MKTDVEQAITQIERALRLLHMIGKNKHTRYLNTALYNLKLYQIKIKEAPPQASTVD